LIVRHRPLREGGVVALMRPRECGITIDDFGYRLDGGRIAAPGRLR